EPGPIGGRYRPVAGRPAGGPDPLPPAGARARRGGCPDGPDPGRRGRAYQAGCVPAPAGPCPRRTGLTGRSSFWTQTMRDPAHADTPRDPGAAAGEARVDAAIAESLRATPPPAPFARGAWRARPPDVADELAAFPRAEAALGGLGTPLLVA